MHHYDPVVGQIDIRVGILDFRIIPLRDLAKEDAGERFRREVQFLADAWNVIYSDVGTEDRQEMTDLVLRLTELLIRHRAIGGAKIDGTLQKLANATSGTNRLVINLNIRMQIMVFRKPLGIYRVRERRPSAIDENCRGG